MQITHEFDEVKDVPSYMIRSFLHENMTEETQKYSWAIRKGQDMTVRIRVADNGYYLSFLGADEEKQKYEDSRIPPWAANWLMV